MDIKLRDCEGNMIFVGNVLKNERSGDLYKGMFSYYTHQDSDSEAYGFWLFSEHGVHPLPKCDNDGRLKLLNISRCDL